jgi:hypothetical protein
VVCGFKIISEHQGITLAPILETEDSGGIIALASITAFLGQENDPSEIAI